MKKITKIAAFALAICMSAVSMTGCGDEKESRKDKRSDDKKVEQALDNADEKELEAAFEEAAVELDQEETTEAETTTEDKASYEPTEEILNADFSSGLIQIGNDVFRIGGYYTVDQFIEEFGDRYDMSVINPDGLLDPGKEGKAELVSVTDPNVIVHINYMSNSEEKSSVGDAIVYFIYAGLNTKRANACWYPQGVTYQPEDFTYSNQTSHYVLSPMFSGISRKVCSVLHITNYAQRARKRTFLETTAYILHLLGIMMKMQRS